MVPASSPRLLNKYIDVVASGLDQLQVKVVPMPSLDPAPKAAAIHLHWLEHHFASGLARSHRLIGRALAANTLRVIDAVRRGGGRLVWTVHNLAPHLPLSGETNALLRGFESQILARVDVFVSLSEAGVAAARKAYPPLQSVPYVVARHPHYRSLRQIVDPERLRAELGLAPAHFVLGALGTAPVRKRVPELIRAFRGVQAADWRLLIAGPCSEAEERALRAEAADDGRIILINKPLTDSEIVSCHAAVDAIVFNGADQMNSGTVMMALSLDRPVIAPTAPSNLEIARLVGAPWVHLFDAPLDAATFASIGAGLRGQSRDAHAPMFDFDPARSAAQLVRAYSSPLETLDR